MKKATLAFVVLLVAAVIVGLTVYLQLGSTPPVEVVQMDDTPPSPPPQPVKHPIVHYPVPDASVAPEAQETETAVENAAENTAAAPAPQLPAVLPRVQKSDDSILNSLSSIIPDRRLFKLVRPENFIPRLVSTIDNLPEQRLPTKLIPLNPPEGRFRIQENREAMVIASDNTKRYLPYLNILKTTRPEHLIKIYVHYYPLFQEAYRQLGYQNAYFNDRLVYVIDHLLQTPNPPDPLAVTQPGVLYVYADPLLEELSAGQKLLLRMGYQQRQEAFELLRDYRQRLTRLNLEE